MQYCHELRRTQYVKPTLCRWLGSTSTPPHDVTSAHGLHDELRLLFHAHVNASQSVTSSKYSQVAPTRAGKGLRSLARACAAAPAFVVITPSVSFQAHLLGSQQQVHRPIAARCLQQLQATTRPRNSSLYDDKTIVRCCCCAMNIGSSRSFL